MAPSARSPSLLVVAAAMSLALFTGHADAQWKWRDGNGRITVSDLPPPRAIPERDILQRPTPVAAAPVAVPAAEAGAASAPSGTQAAASAPGAQAPRTDPQLEARRRAAEQQEAARQREAEAQLAAQRADNCRAARSQLATLQSGQRMVRMNDKGEREFLDDAQRAVETQRARTVIASDCR